MTLEIGLLLIVAVLLLVMMLSTSEGVKIVAGLMIYALFCLNGFVTKPELLPVDISVYHAVAAQTDSTPLITADGSMIDPQNLQQWVAVSRDQLAAYPFGSKLVVRCKCPYDGTEWEVHDVMNARYTTSIDLLVDTSETGKWKGVIYAISH